MKLSIHKETKSRIPGKAIRALFEAVVEGEARPTWKGSVNIVFIGDQAMRRLNRKHRRIDKPTDVLSFNLERPEAPYSIFGEVYISSDTAKRQAKEYDSTLIDEYMRLAGHGLLHLFGYDHKRASDAAAMRRKEAKYLLRVKSR